jgi:hypothetical protein
MCMSRTVASHAAVVVMVPGLYGNSLSPPSTRGPLALLVGLFIDWGELWRGGMLACLMPGLAVCVFSVLVGSEHALPSGSTHAACTPIVGA